MVPSAYCQARARLDPDALELVSGHLCWNLERNVLAEERWLGGRPVKIVDGTGVSMPDTAANQARWPQPSSQQPGCGFPVLKLVGLFSLSSGALLETATGSLHVAAKGFRTRSVVLVTTLLDAHAYPADALRELYGQRWQVELHFQQIKTLLAMDVLRCKSPELIAREGALHRIAYNLIRSLMQRSSHLHPVPLEGSASF